MSSTVAQPEIEEQIFESDETRGDAAKLFHVILLNDEDHSYDYVVEMLMDLFAFSEEKAFSHTAEVDKKGHTRLATLPLTDAEQKRDQIHSYGADPRLPRSSGAMAALVEPAA